MFSDLLCTLLALFSSTAHAVITNPWYATGKEAPQHWLAQLSSRASSRARGVVHGKGNGQQGQQFGVLYKFHEGYTNAVKRPLLVQDLL